MKSCTISESPEVILRRGMLNKVGVRMAAGGTKLGGMWRGPLDLKHTRSFLFPLTFPLSLMLLWGLCPAPQLVDIQSLYSSFAFISYNTQTHTQAH